jgi:lysozyme
VAAILVGTLAVVWFVVVPEQRPALGEGEGYGIDVSNHQGSIDWARVGADGVELAYLKATEGKTFVDPYFATSSAGAHAAGIRTGAYHFFSLCSSGADQAAAFLRTAPPSPAALSPALDLEILGGCSDRPPPAEVRAELDTFSTQVERAWGRPLLIYARRSWTRVYPLPSGADRPRWRTSFFISPGRPWAVWQVQYFARVDGVDGRVDLDVVRPAELST